MSHWPARLVASILGLSLLLGGVLVAAAPANAARTPATLTLEVAGPDFIFVPVARGAQFAVSSITPTTVRWTLTNTATVDVTGFYLYSYGPDCAVSDITIVALGTYVCTEVIQPSAAFGLHDFGALGGVVDGVDFPILYPIVLDIVDDTNTLSFTLSETTLSAEGTLTIAGAGFDDDDALTGILTSTPVPLGSFPVTGGAFSHTFTLPAGLEAGIHTITLYSNGVAYAARSFMLLGAGGAAQLSDTGVDATVPLGLGGMLVVLGTTVLLWGRRRHATV